MHFVATLIANPASRLDPATLARVRAVLPDAGEPVWLDRSIAADVPFAAEAGTDLRNLADRAREAIAGLPVDVVVQPAAQRRKRLFLADMDSTMIGQECIDELADLVGRKTEVAAITEHAMRGEIAFVPALRERVAILGGLPESVIADVIAQRITLTPGGRTLIATMRAHGAYTCLVSGGFTQFIETVSAKIGFHEARGNRLLVSAGKLTGQVADPVFGREGKRDTLAELQARLGLSREETMAIGDGANDLDMICASGLGIAYHAKPAVAAAAAARIDHNDLSALLYVQGYRREEFATE